MPPEPSVIHVAVAAAVRRSVGAFKTSSAVFPTNVKSLLAAGGTITLTVSNIAVANVVATPADPIGPVAPGSPADP